MKRFRIRPYCPSDAAACRVLYTEGLLGGSIAENDSGLDIDDIPAAYRGEGCGFWVACEQPDDVPDDVRDDDAGSVGELIGMIGVQRSEPEVGEIRRLRVRADRRRMGVGSRLLQTAIRHCHDQQYLKICLDTYIDQEPAVALFRKFRFRHDRTRRVQDKQVVEFYLDLYGTEALPDPAADDAYDYTI